MDTGLHTQLDGLVGQIAPSAWRTAQVLGNLVAHGQAFGL